MNRSSFQLRLWWLLAFVALAALDCLALGSRISGRPLTSIMVLLAVLPMANILALGLMPLVHPRDLRRQQLWFWGGFVLVGLTALLFSLSCSVRQSEALRDMLRGICQSALVPRDLTFLTAAAILLAPQLLFAYLGGWLGCRLAMSLPHSGRPEPAWVPGNLRQNGGGVS
jgi:hypothetical protein